MVLQIGDSNKLLERLSKHFIQYHVHDLSPETSSVCCPYKFPALSNLWSSCCLSSAHRRNSHISKYVICFFIISQKPFWKNCKSMLLFCNILCHFDLEESYHQDGWVFQREFWFVIFIVNLTSLAMFSKYVNILCHHILRVLQNQFHLMQKLAGW